MMFRQTLPLHLCISGIAAPSHRAVKRQIRSPTPSHTSPEVRALSGALAQPAPARPQKAHDAGAAVATTPAAAATQPGPTRQKSSAAQRAPPLRSLRQSPVEMPSSASRAAYDLHITRIGTAALGEGVAAVCIAKASGAAAPASAAGAKQGSSKWSRAARAQGSSDVRLSGVLQTLEVLSGQLSVHQIGKAFVRRPQTPCNAGWVSAETLVTDKCGRRAFDVLTGGVAAGDVEGLCKFLDGVVELVGAKVINLQLRRDLAVQLCARSSDTISSAPQSYQSFLVALHDTEFRSRYGIWLPGDDTGRRRELQ